jgi:hypothetical protein
MSWFSLNLFTGATLILLAARVFGLGIGPNLNWIAILTPVVLGEALAASFGWWAHRTEMAAEARKRAEYEAHMTRLQQQVTAAVARTDDPPR